jgi:hypothetical protein
VVTTSASESFAQLFITFKKLKELKILRLHIIGPTVLGPNGNRFYHQMFCNPTSSWGRFNWAWYYESPTFTRLISCRKSGSWSLQAGNPHGSTGYSITIDY